MSEEIKYIGIISGGGSVIPSPAPSGDYENQIFTNGLPITDIDTSAKYYLKHHPTAFPSVTGYANENFPSLVVQHSGSNWKLLRTSLAIGASWTSGGSASAVACVWETYALTNGAWLISNTSGDEKTKGWYNELDHTGSGGSMLLRFPNVVSANTDIQQVGIIKWYNKDNNIYNLDGSEVIVQDTDIYECYRYVNNDWEYLGLSDYSELLSSIKTGKADASTTYTKAEVDTALSNKINSSAIKQTTGQSTTDVMSQKAVTDSINNSKSHNYSTTEQIVGTWIDGKPLYEKTVSANISSGRATVQSLNTLLGITPDYVQIAETNAIDDIGQIIQPYSTDAKLVAPSGADYGNYCSGVLIFPHVSLPEFSTLVSGKKCVYVIYNSFDECFYLLTASYGAGGGYSANFIINTTTGVLQYKYAQSGGAPPVCYKYELGTNSWTSVSNTNICTLSQVNKFKFVYTHSTGGYNYVYEDSTSSTPVATVGNGAAIDVQFFDPVTGEYLDNDQSALGNKAYEGQDYLFVDIDENNNLRIANGATYPVLPMTIYTVLRYTKSTD